MKTFKRLTLLGLLTLLCSPIFAQSNEQNLVDSFYTSGKIKVVIASLGMVLAILIVYMIRLDRKIRKFEKEKE